MSEIERLVLWSLFTAFIAISLMCIYFLVQRLW